MARRHQNIEVGGDEKLKINFRPGKLDLLFLIATFWIRVREGAYYSLFYYFTIQYGQAKENDIDEHELKLECLAC